MRKSINVELTERELEIVQTALHEVVNSIYSDGIEGLPTCVEVKDLSDRIDSIYTDFDQIPASRVFAFRTAPITPAERERLGF